MLTVESLQVFSSLHSYGTRKTVRNLHSVSRPGIPGGSRHGRAPAGEVDQAKMIVRHQRQRPRANPRWYELHSLPSNDLPAGRASARLCGAWRATRGEGVLSCLSDHPCNPLTCYARKGSKSSLAVLRCYRDSGVDLHLLAGRLGNCSVGVSTAVSPIVCTQGLACLRCGETIYKVHMVVGCCSLRSGAL